MEQTPEIPQLGVAKLLNNNVLAVLGNNNIMGFEKAYLIANAVGKLKELLTKEYMKPIMELQGNRLGFKTDKDIAQGGAKGTGYPEDIVKNCLIEAVLFGVQPFGNQFNIIASNMYITKEGTGYLLSKVPGLVYQISPQLPRIKEGSAAVVMDIEWTIGGVSNKKSIDFPIKVNNYMGTDAVIGKATRKARWWLYSTVTGIELPEGDIQDGDATVTSSIINEKVSFEDLSFLYEAKKAVLTPDEQANAERILNAKEENSYSKLHKLLQSK
jgi:hypothetical protein